MLTGVRFSLVLGLMLLTATLCANKVSAQTIINGSFETPYLTAPAPNNFKQGPSGATWVFNSTLGYAKSGISGNGSAFDNLPAPDGTQVAYIQNAGNARGNISQSVSGFNSGMFYTLDFFAAKRIHGPVGTFFSGENPINVLIDGQVILANYLPASTSFSEVATLPFTVTSGTHIIIFDGLADLSQDNTIFIDNVKINVVPEPSALVIMLVGIVPGVMLLRRRR